MKRWWRIVRAFLRIDLLAVCDLAATGGLDFHDYHDTVDRYPDHFSSLTCARCGRKFWT